MAFSPSEYCRLFAQKKAYQGGWGVIGSPGLPPPPLATPLEGITIYPLVSEISVKWVVNSCV